MAKPRKVEPGVDFGPPCTWCGACVRRRKNDPLRCARCGRTFQRLDYNLKNVPSELRPEIIRLSEQGQKPEVIGKKFHLTVAAVERVLSDARPPVLTNVKQYLKPMIVAAADAGEFVASIAKRFNIKPSSAAVVIANRETIDSAENKELKAARRRVMARRERVIADLNKNIRLSPNGSLASRLARESLEKYKIQWAWEDEHPGELYVPPPKFKRCGLKEDVQK